MKYYLVEYIGGRKVIEKRSHVPQAPEVLKFAAISELEAQEDPSTFDIVMVMDPMGVEKPEAQQDAGRKATVDADKVKKQSLGDLKKSRDTDVYDQMALVFLTRDAHSANAFYQTWQDMIENPSLYTDKGIVCPENLLAADSSVIFAPGTPLTTTLDITTYATRKVEQAKEYGRWRMGRIFQYLADKAIVEAS